MKLAKKDLLVNLSSLYYSQGNVEVMYPRATSSNKFSRYGDDNKLQKGHKKRIRTFNIPLRKFKEGKTFYAVSAMQNRNGRFDASISEITLTNLVLYKAAYGSIFAKYDYTPTWHNAPPVVSTSFSMLDNGVVSNGYNFHKLFSTRRNAEKYVENLKKGKIYKEKQVRLFESDFGKEHNRYEPTISFLDYELDDQPYYEDDEVFN